MTAGGGDLTGYWAGLATAVLWTATSLFFSSAVRRLGPTAVNVSRIFAAIVLLGLTHRLLRGVWIPQAQGGQVFYLACSGLVGLTIGDQAMLTALREIGPRLLSLLSTTAPIWAAIFGWIVLGEQLNRAAWLGIALTVSGVAWVALERPAATTGSAAPAPRRMLGYFLGLLAAACQAGGLMLSKQGIGHGWLPPAQHIAPQTAALLRMVFAGLGLLPLIALRAARHRNVAFVRPPAGTYRTGLFFAFCGAVVGPYLGVWMSLVASDRAPLGIAQTLCSLTPIFILPAVILIHGERVSFRAFVGAIMAVGGAALLFWQRT